jgi:hypothetical protein
LDYYKNARTQLEAYLKEILSLDEIPAIVLHMELLPVISEETEKTAKENSIEIKIAKSSNEIESTKYKLSSTGITTSFQADYSKRMAKIHELNVKSLEQSLNFELLRYYEGLKIAMARLKASAEEKNLQLGLLPKVQESHTKGYITAIDYYEKLLEIYEYDRTTHEAELEYIQSLISFLRQSYSDPIVELPKYIETK